MSISGHLAELKRKHAALEVEIGALERAPGSDHLEIARLKKEKLHIRDEIAAIEATTETV